jgi:hypothetical protein
VTPLAILRKRALYFLHEASPLRAGGGLVAASVLLSGFVMLGLIELQRSVQGGSPRSGVAFVFAGGFVCAGIASLALLALTRRIPWLRAVARRVDRAATSREDALRAVSISLAVGVIGSAGLVHLALWKTRYHDVTWYSFGGFYDKRWVLGLYWLAVGTLLVLPPVVLRWIRDRRGETACASQETPDCSHPAASRPRPRVAARLALALCLAWLFYGPPWRIAELPIPLDFHETVHLGGIQAIHKGSVPFTEGVGMYGPGAQLLFYGYMKLTGFSVVGLRECFAAINFVAAIIIFGHLALVIRGPAVFAALVVSLSFSPLAFWWFGTDELRTFYGWANSFRFVGALLLVGLLPAIVEGFQRGRGRRSTHNAFLVGCIWGVFCWIAQNNLLSGALGSGMFLSLCWATRSLSLADVRRVVVALLAGFAFVWLPVLLYYLHLGQLGAFVDRYFASGSLVTGGWANHPWRAALPEAAYAIAYRLSPAVFLLCGLASFASAKGRGTAPMDRRQLNLLAASVLCLASFTPSLLRSDEYHLLAPMIGLPLLFGSAMEHVPRLFSRDRRMRSALALALFVVLCLVYPLSLRRTCLDALRSLARPLAGGAASSVDPAGLSGLRRISIGPLNAAATMEAPSAGRLGFPFAADMECCSTFRPRRDSSMSRIIEEAEQLRRRVGDRSVIVSAYYTFNGYLYFLADLRPATIHTEPLTTLPHSALRKKWLRSLGSADIECIVTRYVPFDKQLLRIFKAKHPEHETWRIGESLRLWCREDVARS